jgi:hypothetical protein
MHAQFSGLCAKPAEFALTFKRACIISEFAASNREFVRIILRSRGQFVNLRVKSTGLMLGLLIVRISIG